MFLMYGSHRVRHRGVVPCQQFLRYNGEEPVEDAVVGILTLGTDNKVPEDDDETVKRGVSS